MSPAPRVDHIRAAAAKAREAVSRVRELLAATERVLVAIEAMLDAKIPNVVAVRKALDATSQARRNGNDAVLGMVEAADQAQDALGARTRHLLD